MPVVVLQLDTPLPAATSDDVATGDNRALYGRDVAFVDNEIPLDAAGDYLTIDDEAALRQAIFIRLIVNPGEYKLRPNFGIGARSFVKKSASKANRDELRRRIFDQLSQERRIEKVLDVTVERDVAFNVQLVRVAITARAFGRVISFQPFTFKEAA